MLHSIVGFYIIVHLISLINSVSTSIANCSAECVHGNCINESCYCLPNFGGQYCNETCPIANHFGPSCEFDCNCITDKQCNKFYTACSCIDSQYDPKCKDICNCRTTCNVGFMGKDCLVPCPEDKFGSKCIGICTCVKENTIECMKEAGDCRCKEKFYGIKCENECNGTLKCPSNPINCTCTPTIEQRIKNLSMKVELVEIKLNKSNGSIIQQIINLFCIICIILLVASTIYIYIFNKSETKKLKQFNGRYSYQSNEPIYEQPKHVLGIGLSKV